jgi:two-component system, NtrC family, response regulator AtoC
MKILLIDDESDIRLSLTRFLKKLGYTVECARNGSEGLYKFYLSNFDVVITDIRMPEMDGLEFLRHIKLIERSMTRVIIITGHGDLDSAVRSLKYGAYDFFQKPLDIKGLAAALQKCAEENSSTEASHSFKSRGVSELVPSEGNSGASRAKTSLGGRKVGLEKLQIYSDAMRSVVELANRYCTYRELPILIEGETGTGKELLARHIHIKGRQREDEPFIALNCAAFPETLFEAELLGHEKGAYTGATPSGQKGKLELAQGGTIFLDEIAELPLNLQAKLLRIIEQRRFFRVGGIKEIDIDVRIISATNRNLGKEVEAMRFRPDLFYRINTAMIRIPPLRERKEAILPLAINFLRVASARTGKFFVGFTSEAKDLIFDYRWPGNVRELENVMLNALLKSCDGTIDVESLFLIKPQGDVMPKPSPSFHLDDCELNLPSDGLKLERLNNNIVLKALEKNSGNITRTAQYLGISRRVLQGRLKKLGSPNMK